MEKLLAKLGFDPKESLIYLCLLEYGPRPASFIAKQTKLNRSSVYYLVEDLVARQLILESESKGVTCFSACEPAELINYLKRQQERLKSLEVEVQDLLPELEAMHHHLEADKPKFSYFQGKKEIKKLFGKTLHNKRQKLWAITNTNHLYQQLGQDYFAEYTQERIKKDILLKVIRTDFKSQDPNHWKSSNDDLRVVHKLPEKIDAPEMTVYLWDERYCAFLSSKEADFGILIESVEFFQTQKTLFNGIWESSSQE